MTDQLDRPVEVRLTRRSAVGLLLGGVAGGLLAACSPSSAPSPTAAATKPAGGATSGGATAPAGAASPAAPAASPAAGASPAASPAAAVSASPAAAASPGAAASPAAAGGFQRINIAPAAPGPKTNVQAGASVLVFSYTPLYVARDKGFWDEQNLNVDLNIFKSGTEQQQAIASDAIMVGNGGATECITLDARGIATPAFTFIQNALVYKIMAKPEIKTVDDLQGKTMAVSGAGALSEQIVRIALSKLGKDPNMLKYQASGGSTQRFAALQAGAVDAAILDAPSNQLAQRAGFNALVNVPDLLPGFPYEVCYAKRDTIQKNRDVFIRYVKGFIKGEQFVNDPANKAEVIRISAKALDLQEADTTLAYEDTIKYFPADGRPTLNGMKLALDGVQKFGNIQGSDKVTDDMLMDDSLVNEVVSSAR